MEEFSVCFTDPLMVDMVLFREWLLGTSEQEAAKRLAISCMHSVGDIPFPILVQEVREQYVLFQSLEPFLRSPLLLNSPMLCSLSPRIKDELIATYYEYDREVMREILGKKMNAKLRKDMEDVSEKTGISLRSCQRQFDNVKNILKTHEDMERGCGLTDILTKHFLFSDVLVDKYYPLIEVFILKFETTKKRLLYLTFDNIISCTEYIFESWRCVQPPPQPPQPTLTDAHGQSMCADKPCDVDDIDRHFLQELRDMRTLTLDKEFQDAHKSFVLTRLEHQLSTLHFIKSVEANFRTICRNLFTVASGLSQTKEFRDLFNDIVEKLVEPIKAADWTLKEIDIFMTAVINGWGDFKEEGSGFATSKYDGVFLRYMEVIKKCLPQMYR